MYDSGMESSTQLLDAMPMSPAELVVALADHERRGAVLAMAIARLERLGQWADDGAVSMLAWLRGRCRMSGRDAAAWVRRGRLLDRYDQFAQAAVDHRLTSSQLTELERLRRPKYEALLAEHQSVLVDQLSPLDAAQTSVACGVWRERADAIIDEAEPPLPPLRSLSLSRDGAGGVLGRLTFDEMAATELEKALSTARTFEGDDDNRTLVERDGDALFDIVSFFNRHHMGAGTPRHLPHVSVSVDGSTFGDCPVGTNDDTQHTVGASVVDTLLCDCKLHTIVRDATGAPLAFGRARYTVPRALFRQVAARDGGCRFPGCDRPVRYCDAHHIRYWRNGGGTDYDNLVLLCNRHHHLVHQQQLVLTLEAGGQLQVQWHTGRLRRSEPRGAPPRSAVA